MAVQALDPRALARLKGLQIRTRQVVDGVLQGIHQSPHHGSSIEFAEHKEYTPGDDIRHIDWKALARLDRIYVKTFEQETNLRGFFVVDTSGSMGYGAEGLLTKFEYASLMVTTLAQLLVHQQDAVALVTFDEEVQKIVPPRAQTGHLKNLAEALEGTRPSGTTRLDAGLDRLSELARKRGLVFVLSDLFGDLDDLFARMRQLRGRGHQVTLFHVLDGDELTFPFEEITLFEGLETGEKLVVEPRLTRDAYLGQMGAFLADVERRCHGSQVQYARVDTREPPERTLLAYLTTRAQRAERVGRRY